VIFGSGLGFS
jgi:hypothetical protein